MANVSDHCLRAWERRHNIVLPERSESGRRLYSNDDVEKLKIVSRLIKKGHSIGDLAKLAIAELKSLEKQLVPSPPEYSDPYLYFSRLKIALKSMDHESIDREILKARINLPLHSFILNCIGPFLHEVGRSVSTERLDIAQEHLLSAIIRNHLGELLSLVQKTFSWRLTERDEHPRFIFATPEGDMHEFGILMAALLAGSRGFKFQYLGPNMPAENLASTANREKVDIIVLGYTQSEHSDSNILNYIRTLDRNIGESKKIRIFIGGFYSKAMKGLKLKCKLRSLNTLEKFTLELDSL